MNTFHCFSRRAIKCLWMADDLRASVNWISRQVGEGGGRGSTTKSEPKNGAGLVGPKYIYICDRCRGCITFYINAAGIGRVALTMRKPRLKDETNQTTDGPW